MIAFLTGTLAHKGLDYVLVEVAGVGYKLAMSNRSLSQLGSVGENVFVHTHMHVRETELSLFGFNDESERAAFLALIEVSGVGPKVALATLSTLSPAMIASAVACDDIALISSVPGIGKKTAQRIVLDLKGRMGFVSSLGAVDGTVGFVVEAGDIASDGINGSSSLIDAQAALLVMGFSSLEIATSLQGADSSSSAQAILKYALGRLNRGV